MVQVKPITQEAYKLFHEGALALSRAEMRGMRIDVEYCKREKRKLTKKIKRLEKEFLSTKLARQWKHVYKSKFNLFSNYQLSNLLYKIRKIEPVKRTDTGKGSTDDEALSALNLPEIKKLLEIRKLTKIRDTYLDSFLREQVNGFIHPFFHLHLVRTFRSSSAHPNFQNIPKRDKESMRICRTAILPREGHQLLEVDYSGIEVRIACCYTKDERLIYDTVHGDMHKDMAIELYMLDDLDKTHPGETNLRQGAKNSFVFPEFYGDYYMNCAENLLKWAEIAELRDGTPALVHLQDKGLVKLDKNGKLKNYKKYIDHVQYIEDQFWNVRYRTYTEWKEKIWRDYQQKGYVDLLTGFRCSGLMNRKDVNNYPIQGAAFHCLLWSFIQIDKVAIKEDLDTLPIGQIHDAVVLDVNPPELNYVGRTVHKIMCEDLPKVWDWIIIPLEVEADICDVDQPWSKKKPYEFPK